MVTSARTYLLELLLVEQQHLGEGGRQAVDGGVGGRQDRVVTGAVQTLVQTRRLQQRRERPATTSRVLSVRAMST